MYPKSPKQEERSKMHVFIGNSMAICCAVCSGKHVPLGRGTGQKGGGLCVRPKTVEATELHQASICIHPSGACFSQENVSRVPQKGWESGPFVRWLLQDGMLIFLGLVKRSQG